jgi:hypothetical protein
MKANSPFTCQTYYYLFFLNSFSSCLCSLNSQNASNQTNKLNGLFTFLIRHNHFKQKKTGHLLSLLTVYMYFRQFMPGDIRTQWVLMTCFHDFFFHIYIFFSRTLSKEIKLKKC